MYSCDTNLNRGRAQIFIDLCNDKKMKRKVTLDRLPLTADAVGARSKVLPSNPRAEWKIPEAGVVGVEKG